MLDFPTSQLPNQCLSEKLITNTLLTLELDPAQRTKERWQQGKKSWTSKIYNKANSAINIIIKVSSWRLYNVYNQQEEVLKPKIAKDYRSLRRQHIWSLIKGSLQTADNKHTGSMFFPFFLLVSKTSRWETILLKTSQQNSSSWQVFSFIRVF